MEGGASGIGVHLRSAVLCCAVGCDVSFGGCPCCSSVCGGEWRFLTLCSALTAVSERARVLTVVVVTATLLPCAPRSERGWIHSRTPNVVMATANMSR